MEALGCQERDHQPVKSATILEHGWESTAGTYHFHKLSMPMVVFSLRDFVQIFHQGPLIGRFEVGPRRDTNGKPDLIVPAISRKKANQSSGGNHTLVAIVRLVLSPVPPFRLRVPGEEDLIVINSIGRHVLDHEGLLRIDVDPEVLLAEVEVLLILAQQNIALGRCPSEDEAQPDVLHVGGHTESDGARNLRILFRRARIHLLASIEQVLILQDMLRGGFGQGSDELDGCIRVGIENAEYVGEIRLCQARIVPAQSARVVIELSGRLRVHDWRIQDRVGSGFEVKLELELELGLPVPVSTLSENGIGRCGGPGESDT